MADDFGILVRADVSEISADVIAELGNVLLGVIQWRTVTPGDGGSYSASGTDNVKIDVSAGGAVTPDWGFRITIDAAVSDRDKMAILAAVIQALQPYTFSAIAFATTFSAGTPTYQFEEALT